MKSSIRILSAFGLAALVAACGAEVSAPREPVDIDTSSGLGLEESSSVMEIFREENAPGGTLSGGAIPVNRYLWRASLDTLEFLPLSSTDPFTGVIVTDWSSNPSAPDERLKVTVYLDTPKLEASSLKVAVYRQVRSEQGEWLAAEVSDATPRRIEDAILTRARQLRVAELQAGAD